MWGDSHAGAVSPAIAAAFGKPGLFAIFNGCSPIGPAPARLRGRNNTNCTAHNTAMLKKIADPAIRTVILVAYWGSESYQFRKSDFAPILRAAKGKRIIILGDNPTPGFNVPWTLALGSKRDRMISRNLLPEIFRDAPVHIIELADALCLDNSCPLRRGPNAIYSDSNHISEYAAKNLVAPFLRQRMLDLLSERR